LNNTLGSSEEITKYSNRFEIELSRGADYQISAKADGYYSEKMIIRRKIRPVFFTNCCLTPFWGIGALIGMGIDFASGNMWEHTDSSITVKLDRVRKDRKRGAVLPIHLSYKNGTREVVELRMRPIPIARN
jgi:hypothetical protein